MRSLSALAFTAALAVVSLAAQETPPLTPDIPPDFDVPTAAYDYVKRDVMIPMRDGVKLHTVIVVPKSATQRADPAHANALQRLRRAPNAIGRRTSSPRCRSSTSCLSPTAISASIRTSAASTDRKASTS